MKATGWSAEWYRWKAGDRCPYCAEGRRDEVANGLRFFAGNHVDGYLLDAESSFGSALVVWRGRHVADPTELDGEEAAGYWRELLAVARVAEARYRPIKLNLFTHGNRIPHLHSVVLLRYEDDPAPNRTLIWSPGERPVDRARLEAEVEALRRLVRSQHAKG